MQKMVDDGNENEEILRQIREFQFEIDCIQEELDQNT